MKLLHCASHGKSKWSGQVICTTCNRVWHLNLHNPPTDDGKCLCGSELAGENGTARAICARCYDERKPILQ